MLHGKSFPDSDADSGEEAKSGPTTGTTPTYNSSWKDYQKAIFAHDRRVQHETNDGAYAEPDIYLILHKDNHKFDKASGRL